MDNGPEMTSRALDHWAYERGVRLRFIAPGKAGAERLHQSFNGRLRDECLNQHWFRSLGDARQIVEERRLDYNRARPHSALGGLTPEENRLGITRSKAGAQSLGLSLVIWSSHWGQVSVSKLDRPRVRRSDRYESRAATSPPTMLKATASATLIPSTAAERIPPA